MPSDHGASRRGTARTGVTAGTVVTAVTVCTAVMADTSVTAGTSPEQVVAPAVSESSGPGSGPVTQSRYPRLDGLDSVARESPQHQDLVGAVAAS